VFKNRLLRRTPEPKREEVAEDWRSLHNEELCDLLASSYMIRMIKSRRMRWAGKVKRMGDTRNAYKIFVGKSEGNRPLWRRAVKQWDDIKMYLKEIR